MGEIHSCRICKEKENYDKGKEHSTVTLSTPSKEGGFSISFDYKLCENCAKIYRLEFSKFADDLMENLKEIKKSK